jgi:hypothetical protein
MVRTQVLGPHVHAALRYVIGGVAVAERPPARVQKEEPSCNNAAGPVCLCARDRVGRRLLQPTFFSVLSISPCSFRDMSPLAQ